ncbi:MAG: helix-turn-helix transcriptional regulator [Chloroflexota bacterium]
MNKVPLMPFSPPDNDSLPFEIKRIEALPKIAMRPIPHRHTFYVLFWVTAGSGTHYLDFVGDEIRPNSLHFVGPGQVHYWDVKEALAGYALLFESALFLEQGDKHLLEQLTFFRTINGLSVLNPPVPSVDWINKMIHRLDQEYRQLQFARSLGIIAWLRLLLIEAQRLASEHEIETSLVSSEQRLTNRYINLVEKNAIAQHKVEWYANQLAVTVAHLSKSVKNAHGITAGSLLRNRLVLEAKRLLVHTNETAATIALQLNFEDASYFGRFFKRETQQTPRQFRSRIPTKYQNQPSN